ncbi:MAG: HAD family hydrolase [Bacillota bacterium]
MFKEKNILLDLDGTLLPIDMDYFLKLYFQSLTKEFSDLKNKEEFIQILMQATEKMIKNDGKRVNEEVFKDSFFSKLDIENENKIMNRFDDFYENKYPKLKNKLELKSKAPELIDILKKADKNLILATNPLFPRKAIEERIKWAGIDPDIFDYITCYEEMHYAKPNPKFYSEISQKINFDPAEAIMIGNNSKEDMIAKKVGMKTYLIKDFLVDEGTSIEPDWEGSLGELIEISKRKLLN